MVDDQNKSKIPIDYASRRSRDLVTEEVIGETGGSRIINAGIIAIFVAVFAFIVWATVTKVNETAVSFGEITTIDKLNTVQHLEGGIVAEVLVEEGQIVKSGQPLVRLSSADVDSQRKQMESRRANLQLYVDRLSDFAQNKEVGIDEVGEQFDKLKASSQDILASKFASRKSQRDVFLQEIQQKKSELDTNSSEIATASRQVDIFGEEEKTQKPLMEKGVTPRVQYLDILRSLETAKGEKERLMGVGETIKQSITELKRKIDELDSRLRADALEERGKELAELHEVEEVLKSSEDRTTRLLIKSPVDGIIKDLKVKTVGGVIPPGGVVAEIVPINEHLIAETRVSTRDIGFIKIGQPVQIKVQTYDFTRFGILNGKVESISPTTFLDEKDNTPFYKAHISLDKNYVGNDPTRYPLLPGMTVQADIITGQKTVLNYILKPIYLATQQSFRER